MNDMAPHHVQLLFVRNNSDGVELAKPAVRPAGVKLNAQGHGLARQRKAKCPVRRCSNHFDNLIAFEMRAASKVRMGRLEVLMIEIARRKGELIFLPAVIIGPHE